MEEVTLAVEAEQGKTLRGYQFLSALLAGSLAGLSVDMILFPLDTVKTRMQSTAGFSASGGFRGIYSGLASAALGSAPNAAIFFLSYEASSHILSQHTKHTSLVHMMAACIGEVTACIVRVPFEVVKQRVQASPHMSSVSILGQTLRAEGCRGLYRGYFSTVAREIPFSIIQYPIWEALKKTISARQNGKISNIQYALCGATAGGIAAAITTPLDVCKTRIMLAETGSKTATSAMHTVMLDIAKVSGVRGLFAGLLPRVAWLSFGGAIFLGIYDITKVRFMRYFAVNDSSG